MPEHPFQQASAGLRPPAACTVGRAMPSCTAKRISRFSKGLRIPTSWRCGRPSWDWPALAITDRNRLAGVVRAHAAAKQLELQADHRRRDRPGRRAAGGAVDDRSGLVRPAGAADHPRPPPGPQGRVPADVRRPGRPLGRACCAACCWPAARRGRNQTADRAPLQLRTSIPVATARRQALARYRELFGDRCYLLAELAKGPDDESGLDGWSNLSRRARLPLVAAGDVHYHARGRLALARRADGDPPGHDGGRGRASSCFPTPSGI